MTRNAGFWERMVETESGCWEWQGCREPYGYGQIRVNGKLLKTHRLAFELTYGYLPEVVCHRCDNPPCCNPSHLFGGTHADNIADRIAKGRSNYNQAKGESNPAAKLTADDVRAIRSRYAAGGVSQPQLAREYGVDQANIWNIIHYRKWRHV